MHHISIPEGAHAIPEFGVVVDASGKIVVVFPNSPAELALLKVGDAIKSIDGVPLAEISRVRPMVALVVENCIGQPRTVAVEIAPWTLPASTAIRLSLVKGALA